LLLYCLAGWNPTFDWFGSPPFFLLLPAGSLAWVELRRGKVRVFLQVVMALSLLGTAANRRGGAREQVASAR